MHELIKITENKYLAIVSDFMERNFSSVHLPSHDQMHHMRVWQYAKEYLYEANNRSDRFDMTEVQKIFFACLFHDSGMSITINSSHGKESRKIFEDFSKKYLSGELPYHIEICEAIEKHDDKEALALGKPDNPTSNTLRILTICDDLDAFGAIGVLRYCEIYLLRKIPPVKIPCRVIENVRLRANFFMNSTNKLKDFQIKHEKRIGFIIDFFTRACNPTTPEFHLINFIQLHVINHTMNYTKFAETLNLDNKYTNLLMQLRQELNLTS